MSNMTLLTDLYQLTMVGGYYLLGKKDQKASFDFFFRKIPENGGFCVAAGLEKLVEYIRNIHLEPEEIAYLRNLNLFPEKSSNISGASVSPGIYTPSRKGRSFSRRNRSSASPPPSLRPSSSKPPS